MTSPTDRRVLFSEVQRFRQWYLRVGIGVAAGLYIGAFLAWSWTTFGARASLDGHGSEPTVGLIAFGAGFIFFAATFAFLITTRLIVEVRTGGLYFKFVPFHWDFRHIPSECVRMVETRTYDPVKDCRGWGIRWAQKFGTVYSVGGKRGVYVVTTDGRKMLLGSHRAEELVQAFRSTRVEG